MNLTTDAGSWQMAATDPLALTRLLDVSEFIVTGIKYDDRLDCLIVFCAHAWEVAVCSTCRHLAWRVHQTRRRVVRDLPLSGRVCYLEFASRRFWCEHCQRPFTEVLEVVAPCARLTRRYEQHVFALCRGASLQKVQRDERLGYKTVERLYYRLARQVADASPVRLVRRLGIDEVALKKGHGQYALILSDLDRGRILTVLPERTKEALEAVLDTWSAEQRSAVQAVALDLWLPYHLAVAAKLPKARITADRFHVMKNLTDQVTAARRAIQRTAAEDHKQALKGSRWLLVKNAADLSQAEGVKLAAMFEVSPALQRLHQLKEDFRTIFETAPDRASAATRLTEWIADVEQSGLTSLVKFLTTLRNWGEPMLNYFDGHLSSGFVEGLNNLVKLIKRRAFGYRNFDHFHLRLLIECDGSA